jgi:hypothetical protein
MTLLPVRTLVFLSLILVAFHSPALARKREPAPAGTPTDYRSQHFLIHTDLSAEEAKDLLERLETMLGLISKYWGRPPSGIIECYVVKDLKNWSNVRLDPDGLQSIASGAGVTITARISSDRAFVAKSVVYAIADRGTPQHEAVHAYCGQTFGNVGPLWYAEGMAEMGCFWREGDKAVRCDPEVVRYIRSAAPRSLNEIVNARSLNGDSWQNYCWRWALCHLLANNPNYSAQFRPLGMGFLTGKNVSFEQTYGAVADQISFEYLFFLKHFDIGYRVDLCSWDWKRKFRPLAGSTPVTAKINAAGGWQGTSATLTAGQAYEYTATGKWQVSKDSPLVDAAGDPAGRGRLMGVLFKDYQLSEEFELGASGDFTAPADGQLYVRANDVWHELADNKGSVSVKLRAKPKT